jgi:hypothetical protein
MTFSTGSIAQLAGGAVNVNVGETNVLVTACAATTNCRVTISNQTLGSSKSGTLRYYRKA